MVELSYGFGGEGFLQHGLPNHPKEEESLTVKIGTTLILSFILPVVYVRMVGNNHESSDAPSSSQAKVNGTTTTKKKKEKTTTTTKVYKYEIVNGKKVLVLQESSSSEKSNHHPSSSSSSSTRRRQKLTFLLKIWTLGILMAAFLVITQSPQNTQIARGIFEAPFLTASEVDEWMNRGARVAARNYELGLRLNNQGNDTNAPNDDKATTLDEEEWREFLTYPYGWRKERQPDYPVTDLQIEADPFTEDDLDWLESKLDARLAPLLERIYGVPPTALKSSGMIFIRYEPGVRTRLVRHTDEQLISFNILLSQNFTGGGTKFWNRDTQQPVTHIQPSRVGQVLMHTGLVDHEGVPVDSGTRFILVGFLDAKRLNDQGRSSGLSWYSSFGSLNWISRWLLLMLNEILILNGDIPERPSLSVEKKREPWYPFFLRSELGKKAIYYVSNFFVYLGDQVAPYSHVQLVPDEHADKYLQALDEAFIENQKGQKVDIPKSSFGQRVGLANWFEFRAFR